jgi:hypothetical protein
MTILALVLSSAVNLAAAILVAIGVIGWIAILIGVIGWIGGDAYIRRCRQCQTEYEGPGCPSCGSAPYTGRLGANSVRPRLARIRHPWSPGSRHRHDLRGLLPAARAAQPRPESLERR